MSLDTLKDLDLNDLHYFARVVEHGGYAAAGRALGIPKSKLSRRVAALETRLGVRLLQRSSRRFSVTDIGRVYAEHCQAMLTQAQAAQEAVDLAHSEPRGQVRFSCPVTLAQTVLADLTASFMALHPDVNVFMEVTNRRVDVIEDGLDLALRVRARIEDSTLVMRQFGTSRLHLVASPTLLERLGNPISPQELDQYPSLGLVMSDGRNTWHLENDEGQHCAIDFRPKLQADDFYVLRAAALSGVGITALPEYFCRTELMRGNLIELLPNWHFQKSFLHAVYPSRRGQIPAVRRFIDFLVEHLPPRIAELRI